VSFFAELKRRNVIRVGIAYAVVAWVLAQIAEFAFENFGAPDWVLKSVVVVLLLGMPLVLIFAWAYEMTPEGIKREREVDRSQSITPQTGRKLDRMIIAVLLVALGWFAWDKFGSSTDSEPLQTAESVAASVAVLPFVAMSNGPDDEYFADGLTEEILNSLAQLPELLVTARTSAFSFKGEDLPPIQEIAATLGVQHIVEGSVRRSGERLRVTPEQPQGVGVIDAKRRLVRESLLRLCRGLLGSLALLELDEALADQEPCVLVPGMPRQQ